MNVYFKYLELRDIVYSRPLYYSAFIVLVTKNNSVAISNYCSTFPRNNNQSFFSSHLEYISDSHTHKRKSTTRSLSGITPSPRAF
jgi:hypothetical protein